MIDGRREGSRVQEGGVQEGGIGVMRRGHAPGGARHSSGRSRGDEVNNRMGGRDLAGGHKKAGVEVGRCTE